MPTVSVIIPTYNRAFMLKEAIQSVLDQTYSDYEVIVVDDGSTDNTREVVNALSDKRVRYVFQENRERSAARNHALSLARGRYIAFLDSDDLFLPTKLEKQVAALEKEQKFGMVYSSAICTDKQGKRIAPFMYKATASGWIYRKVAFYVPITILPTLVMIRTEVLSQVGGFDEKMTRFEDIDMWRRVARRYPILAMQEPLSIFRTHSDNELANQNPDKILRALAYYVNKAFNEDKDESRIFLRRAAARLYLRYGLAIFLSPEWHDSARTFIVHSIKYWPLQIGAYFLLIATYLNFPPFSIAIPLLARLRAAWLRWQNRIGGNKS
jgi:glycosyltransferase involved in cell wall biosynthesis